MGIEKFKAELVKSIDAAAVLIIRGRVTLAEYERWVNDAESLLALVLAHGHPRLRHFYAASSGEPRQFVPDLGQGGADDWTGALDAKKKSLLGTWELAEEIWMDRGKNWMGAGAGTKGRNSAISVEVNPTIHNTATASATATASVAARWGALYQAVAMLPPGEREEALRDLDELRENLEKGGQPGRLRELLGKVLAKGTDVALKLLPILIEYGRAILERLRHLPG